MVNAISKQYELYLIKTETTVNKTGIKVYVEDDVEYTIEVLKEYNPITKDKTPMDLTNCEIDVLAYRVGSKTSILQEYGEDLEKNGKIEIIDPTNGIFKFKPNDLIMACSDKIQVQFTIKDLDEVITVQPMLFIVLPTLDSSEAVIPTNDIKTLRQLEEQIESSRDLIENVKSETSEMTEFFSEKVESLNQKLQTNDLLIQNQLEGFTTKIAQETTRLENEIVVQTVRLDSEVDSIEGRIDELNIELDNATSFIPLQNFLTPIVKEGENYVSFKLTVANYEAKKLASNMMLVNISYQSTAKQQGLSYTGLLTSIFYEDSKSVPYSYMNLTTLYKPSIGGMEIEPSVVFNGSVNKLLATESYYEIWIKTRIPKSELNNAKCILTTFGNKIGVI